MIQSFNVFPPPLSYSAQPKVEKHAAEEEEEEDDEGELLVYCAAMGVLCGEIAKSNIS